MSYLSPQITRRINDQVDRLHARIERAEEINALARQRLEREAADREIARRERRTAIQADAAELYSKWGHSPPIPVSGETSRRYERRVISDMQSYLPPGNPFSSLRLSQLPDDPAAMAAIAPRIRQAFADSYNDPATVREGELREIQATDHAGHRISSFVGRESFIRSMGLPCSKVTGGVNGGLRRNAEMNSRLK
jgi:hypothetical protein